MLLPPVDRFVTLEWLEKGIAKFRSPKFDFDPDFHNERYARYLEWRQKGITLGAWTRLAAELREWGALRSISNDAILSQSPECLAQLDHALKSLLHAHPRRDPDLETTEWSELEPLFEAARNINTGKGKPIERPMLPSKICHFLVPSAFPIADDRFVGVAEHPYPEYWAVCQDGWGRCLDKQAMTARLRAEIEKSKRVVIAEYPWSAKITELCYAAYNSR